MKSRMVLSGILMTVTLAGCTGPNTVARNVETASSINSLAGVPGAGWVGLAASAVDIFNRIGKPTLDKPSEGIARHLRQSPGMVKLPDKEGKVIPKWVTRKESDGRIVSYETAPKISMAYTEAYSDAVGRYLAGDFGDGGESKVRENLAAWEKGELLVAEYNNPNGAKIIIVSIHNSPGKPMLPEEWAEIAKTMK